MRAPYYSDPSATLYQGDCLDVLREMEPSSVHCIVTSPPYYGLRDYGIVGQIGMEATPEEYVARLVEVFREVRRVLQPDGTLWLNLGDSYARDAAKGQHKPGDSGKQAYVYDRGGGRASAVVDLNLAGLKPKDLIGVPWMVAFALRADGWYLRCDIIWSKPNPMPESVEDRPTRAHEYLFLLAPSERYFYDYQAIREPASEASLERWAQDVGEQEGSYRANGGAKTNGTMKEVGGPYRADKQRGHSRRHQGFNDRWDAMTKEEQGALGRNKRSVWTIATRPYPEAHFATYPEDLVEPCILAGCPEDGTVLDPFAGSGTTLAVSKRLGRQGVGIELSEAYCGLARKRIESETARLL